MKCYYDLHIHSALSPCADDTMTPNNIVNMAIIKGLDVIAVTDHNSCGNVRSVMEVARETGLIVIPGMELETSEEVHLLCYFKELEAAEEFEKIVRASAAPIANRPDIFGNQLYYDAEDEVVGAEERMLVTASGLDFSGAVEAVHNLGGAAVPAHIDRTSFSVISNLGFIPENDNIKTLEITAKNVEEMKNSYQDYKIITSSDAHYLGDISERERFLEVVNKNIGQIFFTL